MSSTETSETDTTGSEQPGDARRPTHTPTLHVTPGSIVRAMLIVAAMFVVFTVAMRATDTLWWFAQAAAIAALSYPVVQRLRRHVPSAVAVLGLTALVAGAFAGVAAVTMTELRDESALFRESVPRAVDRLERMEGIGTVIDDLGLDDALRTISDHLADRVQFRGPDLPGLATEVGGRASAVFVIWILTVMLVFSGPSMVHGMLTLVPDDRRDAARQVLELAYGRSVRYLGLTALRSLAMLVITFVAAKALGLGMPGLLALTAAVLAFVPYVGVLLGGIPVALMALLDGTTEAMLVLGAVVALQVLDSLVVQPRIDRRSMQLGLFPTMVAVMIGYSLRGPGGLLIAVAIAAMLVGIVNDTGAVRSLRQRGDGADPGSASPGPAAAADPA
ncbi:MAG: AI-2E family transporter [Microthrixaceae bacterium]